LDAYRYLWSDRDRILHSLLITIALTVTGTVLSTMITSMLAYAISRKKFVIRKGLNFVVFFSMLFNGGLVPTYIMYTQFLHVKDTFWGLLLPNLLVSGFHVMMMRTYYTSNIHDEILESAAVDGAGEFRTFFQIVMPMSVPILATVGLLSAINYSNDWYNGLIYLNKPSLFSLQNLLNRILMDLQFLRSENTSDGSLQNIPLESARMAMAVIGIAPILCAYPFFQRYFVKGITVGSVKG